jgi:transcriptional regulator with XRE-family HTH domain
MPQMGGIVSARGPDAVFAQRMRAARIQAGITQRQVADHMRAAGYQEIHRSTVGKIEAGDRPVSLAEAVQFASLLDIRLGDLLRGGDVTAAAGAAERLLNLERQLREKIAAGILRGGVS